MFKRLVPASIFLSVLVSEAAPGAAVFQVPNARRRLEGCAAGPGGLRLTDPREASLDQMHQLLLMKLWALTVLGDRTSERDLSTMGLLFGGLVHKWSNHLPRRDSLAMYNDDPVRGPVSCIHGVMREALDASPITAAQRRVFLAAVNRALAVAHGASAPAQLMLKFGLGRSVAPLQGAFAAEDPGLVLAINRELRDRLAAECEHLLLK